MGGRRRIATCGPAQGERKGNVRRHQACLMERDRHGRIIGDACRGAGFERICAGFGRTPFLCRRGYFLKQG